MYGFLILLPLTLISLFIGFLIASSPQLADYVAHITDIVREQSLEAVARSWMMIGSYVATYAVLCFVLAATVRTISAPLPPDRPAALRVLQVLLEALFVAVPSMVLLWINGQALSAARHNWVNWLTVGVVCVGLLTTVAVTLARRPLELYASSFHVDDWRQLRDSRARLANRLVPQPQERATGQTGGSSSQCGAGRAQPRPSPIGS
jgi:hypothetical protein